MAFQRKLEVGQVMTNCYIVADEVSGEAAVIDPGDNAQAILEVIAAGRFRVKYIFLTHGHFDHVLAVDAVRDATGAQCVIHRLDAGLMTHPPYGLAVGRAPRAADILTEDGAEFAVGSLRFVWMHTPGHTPGSCCIVCGRTIYSGDTLFEDDCGRCDLPGGDYSVMLESLRRLAALDGDYAVHPGHDVSTTLSRERACNSNMLEALGL